MSEDIFEIEPSPKSTLNWHIPWWLLAALGFAVAELTAHPALGVAILCVKFGLNDWRTAAWLCKVDPLRIRSTTIWWFLVGCGFLKIFVMASVCFPFLACFWAIVTQQDVSQELVVAVLIGLAGITEAFVMTHIGIVLASRRGIRIWLNNQLHRCRDENRFPPKLFPPNSLDLIVSVSVIPAIFGFLMGSTFALLAGFFGGLPQFLIGGSMAAAFFGTTLLSHAVSVKRIVARTPDECWFTPDEAKSEPDTAATP